MAKLAQELVPEKTSEQLRDAIEKMARQERKLTILMIDRDKPAYTFEGNWTGRDILVLKRTLTFAYRKQQLAIRRAAGLSEITPTISAKG